MSISHNLVEKSNNLNFSMTFMYLNMILLDWEAKVPYNFWMILLIPAIVYSRLQVQLMRDKVERN